MSSLREPLGYALPFLQRNANLNTSKQTMRLNAWD